MDGSLMLTLKKNQRVNKLIAMSHMWNDLLAMWTEMNNQSATEERFETRASRFRLLAKAFAWRQTVWVHFWTCHMGQMVREWGCLFPFMQYGFEARHKKDYATLANSTHGTTNSHSGYNGIFRLKIPLRHREKIGRGP
jgi:hypothetical protein